MSGTIRFEGLFRILTALGSYVILPPEYAEWICKHPDVSRQALVAEDFFLPDDRDSRESLSSQIHLRH